jgi:hypothetical protein
MTPAYSLTPRGTLLCPQVDLLEDGNAVPDLENIFRPAG